MAIWMPVTDAAGILILPVILTNIWQAFFGAALKLILTRLWSLLVALMVGSAVAAMLIASANQALADGLLGTMLIIYAGLAISVDGHLHWSAGDRRKIDRHRIGAQRGIRQPQHHGCTNRDQAKGPKVQRHSITPLFS